jgi:small subunit ribosomal protein S6
MRYLTLRVDAHEEGPSAVMQSKNDRGSSDSRPRRRDFEDEMEGMEEGVA